MNETRIDPVELAAETLLGDLMQLVLGEIRAAPDVWPKLSQYKQDEVIDRVQRRCADAVRQCVQLIACKGRTAIPGALDSVTVKDGLKAVIKFSQADPNRHELIDATGRSVIVIVADAAEFSGGTDEVKSQPDQPDLPIDDVVEAHVIEGGARIFVRRSTQSGVMQLPKSARSTRTLPLPDELAPILRAHIEQRYMDNPNRLLFCSGAGNPLWLDHVRERRLWPILDELGIPRCGFHAFRHTNGSVFASTGAPVKVAQEHLGHTDPRVTLEIYTHVINADHRKAAGKVARVLLPACYLGEVNELVQ